MSTNCEKGTVQTLGIQNEKAQYVLRRNAVKLEKGSKNKNSQKLLEASYKCKPGHRRGRGGSHRKDRVQLKGPV